MPFCKCGELCLDDKCSKCGFDFAASPLVKGKKYSMVDRWQSRYLGSVIGLDSLSSKTDEKDASRSACSPLTQRTTSPILKRISRPFNLLDSRRVAPSKSMTSPSLANARNYSLSNIVTTAPLVSNACGHCNKKLSGKTVRLPDTQVKYHWKCLKCKGCQVPFEDTSFFIDASKNVYHPNCVPATIVTQNCARCSQTIIDNYMTLNNTTVLHPRCFRCTGCQKILHPASIYIDLNGSYCQTCSNEKLPNDKDLLTEHMKIVPQLQHSALPKQGSPVLSLGTASCCTSPSSEKVLSPLQQEISEAVKPSSLMSSRGRPLPRFGFIRDCAGCSQRILSVHEEIPGPKASKWHKKCLACTGCLKTLDSGATVHQDTGTGSLKPWCTTCLLTKRKNKMMSSSLSHQKYLSSSNSASALFSHH